MCGCTGVGYSRPTGPQRALRPEFDPHSPGEEQVDAAVSAELEHIWPRVQAELAAAVGEATYRLWLEPLTACDLSHGRLSVEAPVQACGWVRDRYGRVLQACVTSVIGPDVTVELLPSRVPAGEPMVHADGRRTAGHAGHVSVGGRREHFDPNDTIETPALQPAIESRAGALANPKLTFDQFVIGDCNRLAHAAALTVAEMPAQAYNPLFICGPPGVGKTHLLGSIASLLLAHNPGLAVRCTTGEAFTNEFLQALAGRQTETFKNRHRQIDVLLVDDVQFLERKTRTEEEFFHTFNALYDGGRQIVLSSDRPPRDLQALEDRLRERFESGLVADIQPPDPATRMTILRKRAQHDRLKLSDDSALELIAERVTENVRAIEGALIRVVAFSSLTGRPLTVELTREVLDGLYPTAQSQAGHGHVSIEQIQNAACEHFGITPAELISSSRTARVAWPRQVAMYLARELTDASLPAIGRQFGERDHTTVMHACRRAASRIAEDNSSRRAVDSVIEDLHSKTRTNS
jgi:chromosomal replication initiator protein